MQRVSRCSEIEPLWLPGVPGQDGRCEALTDHQYLTEDGEPASGYNIIFTPDVRVGLQENTPSRSFLSAMKNQ